MAFAYAMTPYILEEHPGISMRLFSEGSAAILLDRINDYRKGMLTDRGMVYIILGAPKMLAITSTSEVWTYRDTKSGQKIRFVFRRTRTKLSGEKYVLRRSTEFKTTWDHAVQTWRKGSIFTF